MSEPEPLPLETYALALAHLIRRRREPVAEVLGSIGVSAEAFSAAERYWTEELAQAFVRRKGALAMRFASAWADAHRQVGLLDPAAGEAPAAAWSPPAAPPAAKPDVPSFLRPGSEPGALPLPPPAAAPPAPVAMSPAPVATPPSPAPVDAPPDRAPANPLAETNKMDVSAVARAIESGKLPFKYASPAALAALREASPPAADPRPARPARSGATASMDASAFVPPADRAPLPFARHDAGGAAGAAEAKDDADLAQLPLETYASVSAALARGEPRPEALARHGLRAEAFDKLAKAWAQRFQREPHLLARFKELAKGMAGPGRQGE
jgi:hypothetical protein